MRRASSFAVSRAPRAGEQAAFDPTSQIDDALSGSALLRRPSVGARDSLAESPRSSHPYARFLSPIRAKCQRLLGRTAAAEDVAQEAFLRLWKSDVGARAEAGVVMAWLYRTCTRLAID